MDPAVPSPPADPRSTYWLTRFFILRLLGTVYVFAFLAAARQLLPLIGSDGLTPVGSFLDGWREYFGSGQYAFWHLPSLFWLNHSDAMLLAVSWAGFGLAVVVALGWANVPLMAVLWGLYLSIVHVGQVWYGYGWEDQLLETGFIAIFLCPLWDARPFSRKEPPRAAIWLMRWLIFRIMLGSGLIKLRGDASWRDLTALYYHFETQPLPNALSRWFDFLPRGVLKGGVVFNHLAELGAPWLVFWPRWGRRTAGAVIIGFQIVLILGGNLSFLNWLTIIPALACLDDGAWLKLCGFLRGPWAAAVTGARRRPPMPQLAWAAAGLIALLSIKPVLNLISPNQVMNTSFDPFDLVNTYGAFGSVGQVRYNAVFEGTDAPNPDGDVAWKPYRYKGLPVDLDRRPPQVAPYQLRLDWQMWFAGMENPRQQPWTLHLIWKLLRNDPGALSLFADNPFPRAPPRFIRVMLYRYKFAPAGRGGAWWSRTVVGQWLPPLSRDDPEFRDILKSEGWLDP